jgi:hypothetical protein
MKEKKYALETHGVWHILQPSCVGNILQGLCGYIFSRVDLTSKRPHIDKICCGCRYIEEKEEKEKDKEDETKI